jgi:hypothetical protein
MNRLFAFRFPELLAYRGLAQQCVPSVVAGPWNGIFSPSSGVAVDPKDLSVFVYDQIRHAILMFTATNSALSVVAGDPDPGNANDHPSDARLNGPEGF